MPSPRPARSETALLATGMGLMLVHNVDEAFIHPEDGGLTNLIVVGVVALLALAFLRRLPGLWRAGVLAVLGVLGLVNGVAGHVVNLFGGHPAAIDYSGVLFALGGGVLVYLAVMVLLDWRAHQRGARA